MKSFLQRWPECIAQPRTAGRTVRADWNPPPPRFPPPPRPGGRGRICSPAPRAVCAFGCRGVRPEPGGVSMCRTERVSDLSDDVIASLRAQASSTTHHRRVRRTDTAAADNIHLERIERERCVRSHMDAAIRLDSSRAARIASRLPQTETHSQSQSQRQRQISAATARANARARARARCESQSQLSGAIEPSCDSVRPAPCLHGGAEPIPRREHTRTRTPAQITDQHKPPLKTQRYRQSQQSHGPVIISGIRASDSFLSECVLVGFCWWFLLVVLLLLRTGFVSRRRSPPPPRPPRSQNSENARHSPPHVS